MSILVAVFFSAAAMAGVDMTVVPGTFCESGDVVSARSITCRNNVNFVTASAACLAKLNLLEAELGKDAMATAAAGRETQHGRNEAGAREYAFSEASSKYLSRVAEVAYAELEWYPLQIAYPDALFEQTKGDLMQYSEASACYGGNKRKIAAVMKRFSEKLAMYRVRGARSAVLKQQMGQGAAGYGSIGGKTAEGGQGTGTDAQGISTRQGSGISGDVDKK